MANNEITKVICNRSDLIAIADSVRNKTGIIDMLTLGEIKSNIDAIEPVIASLEVTENGTYTAPDGVDGYGTVTVNVESGAELPQLTNPASEEQVFEGYEVIDETGSKKVGTFTIEDEVTEQTDLIAQISALLEEKATYNTIYIGTTAPTDDFGINGDIYIVRSGTA